MRMWMVNPKIMCRQHLLGEHMELHMIDTWLRKGKRLGKLAERGFVDPSDVKLRHCEIIQEMFERGYKHEIDLHEDPRRYIDWDNEKRGCRYFNPIDVKASKRDLLKRCPECRKRSRNYRGEKWWRER